MTSQDERQLVNDAYAHELYLSVTERLGSQVRSLSIRVSDAGIILSGHCDTYYVKQLVQEIVGKYTSRPILSNLIVVRDMPAG